jgi:predicted transcriptional regulator
MGDKVLLLSIRPEHAEKIFRGQKKVELRRIRPKVKRYDKVVVYVSSPVKALMGLFEVERVVEELPQYLWWQVRHDAGVSKQQFDHYYTGARIGFGIFLTKAEMLPKPIPLTLLRKEWIGFHPPQSYRYLTLNELKVFYGSLGWEAD